MGTLIYQPWADDELGVRKREVVAESRATSVARRHCDGYIGQ